MAEKRVDIVIAARNEADAAFQQVSQRLDRARAQMEQSQKASLESLATFNRHITNLAKVRIVVEAAAIGVNLFRGEWDKVNEAVDQLPMGIGQLVQALRPLADFTFEKIYGTEGYDEAQRAYLERMEQLKREREATNLANADLGEMRRAAARDVLTGADAQARALNDQWEKMQFRIDEIITRMPHLAETAQEVSEELARSFETRLQRVRDEQQRQLREQANERRRLMEDLDSEIHQRHLKAQGLHLDAELEQIRQHFARRIELAKDAAERERLERLKALDEEQARRQADQQEDQIRRTVEDLDSEIRQRQLEAEGKHLEAELEQIRQHYKRRIEMAKDAAERERLERLKALDEERARALERERLERQRALDAELNKSPGINADTQESRIERRGVAPVEITNGFMGLTARFMGGQDPAMRISRDTARVVKLLEQALKSLEKPDQIIAGIVLRP